MEKEKPHALEMGEEAAQALKAKAEEKSRRIVTRGLASGILSDNSL